MEHDRYQPVVALARSWQRSSNRAGVMRYVPAPRTARGEPSRCLTEPGPAAVKLHPVFRGVRDIRCYDYARSRLNVVIVASPYLSCHSFFIRLPVPPLQGPPVSTRSRDRGTPRATRYITKRRGNRSSHILMWLNGRTAFSQGNTSSAESRVRGHTFTNLFGLTNYVPTNKRNDKQNWN